MNAATPVKAPARPETPPSRSSGAADFISQMPVGEGRPDDKGARFEETLRGAMTQTETARTPDAKPASGKAKSAARKDDETPVDASAVPNQADSRDIAESTPPWLKSILNRLAEALEEAAVNPGSPREELLSLEKRIREILDALGGQRQSASAGIEDKLKAILALLGQAIDDTAAEGAVDLPDPGSLPDGLARTLREGESAKPETNAPAPETGFELLRETDARRHETGLRQERSWELLEKKLAEALERLNARGEEPSARDFTGEESPDRQPGQDAPDNAALSRDMAFSLKTSGTEGEPDLLPGAPGQILSALREAGAVAGAERPAPYTERQAADIVRQVARNILQTTQDGARQIGVQLVPEHLGKVQISMELKDGHASGKIGVENEAVRQILESRLGQLREAIEAQSVKLDSLEVSVAHDRAFLQGRQNGRQQEGSRDGGRLGGEAETGAVELEALTGSDTGRRLGYNTMELVA